MSRRHSLAATPFAGVTRNSPLTCGGLRRIRTRYRGRWPRKVNNDVWAVPWPGAVSDADEAALASPRSATVEPSTPIEGRASTSPSRTDLWLAGCIAPDTDRRPARLLPPSGACRLPSTNRPAIASCRPLRVTRALPVGQVVVPQPVICLAVGPHLHAVTFGLAVDPVALIVVAIGPHATDPLPFRAPSSHSPSKRSPAAFDQEAPSAIWTYRRQCRLGIMRAVGPPTFGGAVHLQSRLEKFGGDRLRLVAVPVAEKGLRCRGRSRRAPCTQGPSQVVAVSASESHCSVDTPRNRRGNLPDRKDCARARTAGIVTRHRPMRPHATESGCN